MSKCIRRDTTRQHFYIQNTGNKMKKTKAAKQKETKEVLDEGLSQQKPSSAKLNAQYVDSPSLFDDEETGIVAKTDLTTFNFTDSPFAKDFQSNMGLNITTTVDITEGDVVCITTSFDEYEITGSITQIEGLRVTLDNGWSWYESEGIREITNGTELHVIKSIGVIHA